MKLSEHSEHELHQRNIPPELDDIKCIMAEGINKKHTSCIKIILKAKKKTLTMTGQNVHAESAKPQVELGNHE